MKLARLFFYLFLISIPFGARILLYQFTTGFNEYEAVFLYASDILMIAFIVAFIFSFRENFFPKPIWLRVFFFFAFLSIFFAFSKGLALYSFVRLVLLGATAYFTANLLRNGLVKLENIFAIIAGSAIFQSLIAIAQFFKQSGLGLKIIGESIISSNINGVAKVAVSGAKLIRAYGTFPHPNVLAAFLLLGLISLYYLFLKIPNTKSQIPNKLQFSKFQTFWNLFGAWCLVLGIFSVSLGLLLAFSRTAWVLAFLASIAVIIYSKNWRLAIILLVIGLTPLAVFRPYIFPRIKISANEPSVSYRLEYNQLGFYLTLTNPLGVGIGNQVPYSIKENLYPKFGLNQPWQEQPIHNIYLLMASEIGLAGLISFIILLVSLILNPKSQEPNPKQITNLNDRNYKPFRILNLKNWNLFGIWNLEFGISAIMLASLLLFGLFDHFLWTLQPGRLMLWLVIGLSLGLTREK